MKMKSTMIMASALALSLVGTGCATKKYVAKTIAPVEQRVTGTEGKNTEQDKQITGHTQQIEETERDLSRTKEKLTDTDAKAVAAGQAAQKADEKADGAWKTADGARSLAEKGIDRSNQLERTMESMKKFQMLKSEAVLFKVNKWTLNDDAKAQLDEIAKSVNGMDRYVIEIQGFTDKTGSPAYNETLSEQRAQEVARYLANEHKIPLRNITMLGSGYALPVADDKTREGRKMNRRVEVRIWVPETSAAGKAVASKGDQ